MFSAMVRDKVMGLGLWLVVVEAYQLNQSCFFTVVQVTKSLQDPLVVGNNLPGISDNVRKWGLEQQLVLRMSAISYGLNADSVVFLSVL